MFIIVNRTHTLVALGAVAATAGSAATASAATAGHQPETIAPIVVNYSMIADIPNARSQPHLVAGAYPSSGAATGE